MNSSILTNTSAMVALQTLRGTNTNLAKVQDQISTGMRVAKARDDAAIFSIAQVMRSDVGGFTAVSESLQLGLSTVSVASNASQKVWEALNEIKQKIVNGSNNNLDPQTIQNEIVELRDSIEGFVAAAQFNGLNLLDGSISDGNIKILSSLDRNASGSLQTNKVTVSAQNLSTNAGSTLTAVAAPTDPGTAGVVDGGGSNNTITVAAAAIGGGGTTALARDHDDADVADLTGVLAGDQLHLTLGDQTAIYTVQEGDTAATIGANFAAAINELGVANVTAAADAAGVITVTNAGAATPDDDVAFTFEQTRDRGINYQLTNIDVTVDADTALFHVENMLQATADAQAALGSSEKRLDLQDEFMSTLIDSFKSGIGSLVDADLEAASARLQALQVQQQLGVQALSIANQAPQNILALFR